MTDAYDRVDLHDKIMALLRGRIKMGAGRKRVVHRRKAAGEGVTAGRKRRVGRPRKAAGEGVRKRRVRRAAGEGEGAGRKRVVRKRAAPKKDMVHALSQLLGMGDYGDYDGYGVSAGRKRVVHRRRAAGEGEGAGRRRVHHRRAAGEGEGEGRRRVVRRKRVGGTTSPWIKHVKAYAKAHNIPYGEAMSRAAASY